MLLIDDPSVDSVDALWESLCSQVIFESSDPTNLDARIVRHTQVVQLQADIDKLGEWVTEFKKHREWFAVDTCVHADSADPAVRLDGMVKPDKSAAFYRFTQVTTSATYPAAPVHLPGLDPDATYRIVPLWLDLDLDGLGIGNGQSALGWWNENGVLMTGRALQTYGLRPPSLHPAQAVLFTAVRE